MHGATGPVVGVSKHGPSVGWEGSLGLGPLQATAGGLWRPFTARRWLTMFAGLGPTLAAPLNASGVEYGAGGVVSGGHVSAGSAEGTGFYGDFWGGASWARDGQKVCGRVDDMVPMASVSVGVKVLLTGAQHTDEVWEAYVSPKLAFVDSPCLGIASVRH